VDNEGVKMELDHLVVDVAIIVAITAIVIFIAGSVIETIASVPNITCCRECHDNLNATENASACLECQKIWSNAYT